MKRKLLTSFAFLMAMTGIATANGLGSTGFEDGTTDGWTADGGEIGDLSVTNSSVGFGDYAGNLTQSGNNELGGDAVSYNYDSDITPSKFAFYFKASNTDQYLNFEFIDSGNTALSFDLKESGTFVSDGSSETTLISDHQADVMYRVKVSGLSYPLDSSTMDVTTSYASNGTVISQKTGVKTAANSYGSGATQIDEFEVSDGSAGSFDEVIFDTGLDTSGPLVDQESATDVTNEDGTYTKGDTIEVSAEVTDVSGVESVDLFVNGEENATANLTDAGGDNVYNASFEAPGEITSLEIKATDTKGLSTTVSGFFSMVYEKPEDSTPDYEKLRDAPDAQSFEYLSLGSTNVTFNDSVTADGSDPVYKTRAIKSDNFKDVEIAVSGSPATLDVINAANSSTMKNVELDNAENTVELSNSTESIRLEFDLANDTEINGLEIYGTLYDGNLIGGGGPSGGFFGGFFDFMPDLGIGEFLPDVQILSLSEVIPFL